MRHRTWNLDVDRLFAPLVPPPPWALLPYPVAYFLGHRKVEPSATGNLMPIFWAFLGALSSILVIEAVTTRVPLFEAHGVPMILGSFGAAAVLEFYAIQSPLAQPRGAVVGHAMAAVVGVAVAKLFALSPRFDELRWVGGALACASATALMGLSNTVHPPAGATALLAVVDSRVSAVGWLLIPVTLLGCALMLSVALVVNNIERRFPLYWWTPLPTREKSINAKASRSAEEGEGDTKSPWRQNDEKAQGDDERSDSSEPQSHTEAHGALAPSSAEIIVRRGQLVVPECLSLSRDEMRLLESISSRL